MSSRAEELAWITRCKLLRDQRAFAHLIDAYSDRVRNFFLIQTGGDEMLSDDLAQETFIKVWLRLPDLSNPLRFSSWLYRIAYNIWMDHLRQRKTMESIDGVSVKDVACLEDSAPDIQMALHSAMSKISEQERMVLTLYYLNEMRVKDISSVTGMAEGTIKSHLARGRAKLRQMPEIKDLRDEK